MRLIPRYVLPHLKKDILPSPRVTIDSGHRNLGETKSRHTKMGVWWVHIPILKKRQKKKGGQK